METILQQNQIAIRGIGENFPLPVVGSLIKVCFLNASYTRANLLTVLCFSCLSLGPVFSIRKPLLRSYRRYAEDCLEADQHTQRHPRPSLPGDLHLQGLKGTYISYLFSYLNN